MLCGSVTRKAQCLFVGKSWEGDNLGQADEEKYFWLKKIELISALYKKFHRLMEPREGVP